MNYKIILGSLVIAAVFVKYTQKKEKQVLYESEDEEEPDTIETIIEEPSLTTYITTLSIIGGLAAYFTSNQENFSTTTKKIRSSKMGEYIRPGPANF